MGHDANRSNRRVIDVAEDCLAAANENTTRVEAMVARHNDLCADLDTRFTKVHDRLEAHGEWCRQNEERAGAIAKQVSEARAHTDGKYSTLRQTVQSRLDDEAAARLVAGIERFEMRCAYRAFLGMTLGQRLWWFLTGRFPHQARTPETHAYAQAGAYGAVRLDPASATVLAEGWRV